jgi:hypothetical protein
MEQETRQATAPPIHERPSPRTAAITFACRLADRLRQFRVMLVAAAFLTSAAVGSVLAAQAVNGNPNLRSALPYVLYAVFAGLSLLVLRAGPPRRRRSS